MSIDCLMDDLRDFHDHCIRSGDLELSELIKSAYLKMDESISDNALLKTAGEDLLEAVKDSNIHLSKSTEVVSLLKDKVKELESALKEIYSINWGYDGDCGATRIIDNVLD